MTQSAVDRSSFDPTQVLIVDGGPHPPSLPRIPSATLVIAVDSGYEHARSLGIKVDVVVGDLDSVTSETLLTLDAQVAVEKHDTDKDESDLALALKFAQRVGAKHIDVITGGNGRLDHLLVGSMLLASQENLNQSIVTHCGTSRMVALGPGKPLELDNLIGSWLSLIALEAEAKLSTTGLRWNLTPSAVFPPFSSLGLSNQILEKPTIDVQQGIFLAIVSCSDA
ncbi:MAG: thiamine diphosphokinase [Acidimicrobiales bacterium]|nr:thiamine diphosphokinase [Acidimicrobiales bacterium]